MHIFYCKRPNRYFREEAYFLPFVARLLNVESRLIADAGMSLIILLLSSCSIAIAAAVAVVVVINCFVGLLMSADLGSLMLFAPTLGTFVM